MQHLSNVNKNITIDQTVVDNKKNYMLKHYNLINKRGYGGKQLITWLIYPRCVQTRYPYSLVHTSQTPSLRRPLHPSYFCVGMSDTQRESPPGLPDWAIFPA